MKKTGLTRIELVIVLTVIAFLSCILVPALARTLQQSRFVKCMSNMRTLGRATLIYTADHDGYYPLLGNRKSDSQSNIGGGSAANQPTTPWWDARIKDYISSNLKNMKPQYNQQTLLLCY